MSFAAEPELKLSIIITIVGGKVVLRRCLQALACQVDYRTQEIIVPFDKWSREAAELAAEFPEVQFHWVKDLGIANDESISSYQHRLYDCRRAAGLRIARGGIVAMTENFTIPEVNWVQTILAAHAKNSSAEVIGGAIENKSELALNRALYFCDFGRYGRPLEQNESEFISDINVSYKREALNSIKETWHDEYHETTVHWALRKRGAKLRLDPKIVVFQHRPPLKFITAWRERVEWGRIFAETRIENYKRPTRLAFAAGTIFLPPLLAWRAFKNMRRCKISFRKMAETLPIIAMLLIGWSLGEFSGYLFGKPQTKIALKTGHKSHKIVTENFIQ